MATTETDAIDLANQAVRDAYEHGRAAGRAEVWNELGGEHLPTLVAHALADGMAAIGSRLQGHDPNLGRILTAFGDDLRGMTAQTKVVHVAHRQGEVHLTFDGDMDGVTLPGHATIRNANGGHPLKAVTVWDAQTRTLIVTPARQLEAGTKYEVRVAGEARNLRGVPLGDEYVHTFTAR